MSSEEIAVLSLIIAVFVTFGAILGWQSRYYVRDQPVRRPAPRADHATSPLVSNAMAPASRNTVR